MCYSHSSTSPLIVRTKIITLPAAAALQNRTRKSCEHTIKSVCYTQLTAVAACVLLVDANKMWNCKLKELTSWLNCGESKDRTRREWKLFTIAWTARERESRMRPFSCPTNKNRLFPDAQPNHVPLLHWVSVWLSVIVDVSVDVCSFIHVSKFNVRLMTILHSLFTHTCILCTANANVSMLPMHITAFRIHNVYMLKGLCL